MTLHRRLERLEGQESIQEEQESAADCWLREELAKNPLPPDHDGLIPLSDGTNVTGLEYLELMGKELRMARENSAPKGYIWKVFRP